MGLFDGLKPSVVPPMSLGRRNPGHKIMLEDRARVEPYREALRRVVTPETRVLDLGCGTGLLGLLALQAGAKRLHAIEATNTVQVARRVAVESGFKDRVQFYRGLSSQARLPERVDLLVAEILGDFCYEEQILDITLDARERFLEPGGRLMPYAVRAFLVPMEHAEFYDGEIGFWASPVYGLSYGCLRDLAVHQEYSFSIGTAGFLAEPAVAFAHDLRTVRETHVACDLVFRARRPGTLHGLGGWFEADLAEGVVLSTAPHLPETTWRQVFFPVQQPLAVREGDEIRVSMRGAPRERGFGWTWKIAQFRGGVGIASHEHGNFRVIGMFPEPSEEEGTPGLSDDQRVNVFVLAQCDGKRSLGEAAERLQAEFPARFPDRVKALEKVLAVIQDFSKPAG